MSNCSLVSKCVLTFNISVQYEVLSAYICGHKQKQKYDIIAVDFFLPQVPCSVWYSIKIRPGMGVVVSVEMDIQHRKKL